ncbi:MAG: hypothetical protein JWM44_3108 [Bacilli bacterium]|nr:hypothetical protein [Bacilli bacterium]
MSREDELYKELKQQLGYDFIIVKSTVYNQDIATFRKLKSMLNKYREALEEITEATSMDEMREIAEDAISE